jgi:heme o synthase
LPAEIHRFPFMLLIHTLIGTLLVASGASTLNQYVERRFDARMRRTARRPLASGRLEPSCGLWFGIVLSFAGGIYLAVVVNALASLLAVFTLVSYLALYTPLKRKTPLCTVVGAVPGAIPPLIGWAAASGQLSLGAWALYAILFLWQFPHFMAIAWMYRDDYSRAGSLYFAVAILLSLGFLYYSARLAYQRSNAAARKLLMASIVYLPLLLLFMVLDKR